MADTVYKIDEITWHDLDMDSLVARLDHSDSSVGSEYLKTSLQTLLFSAEKLKDRSRKAAYFEEHALQKDLLSKCFKKLGKTKKYSFPDYIFRLKEVPAKSNLPHILLCILLILSFILIFLSPAAGIVAFVVMIAVNIISYFKTKAGIEGYFNCLKYLVSMVVCAKNLLDSGALDQAVFEAETTVLSDSVRIFSGLKRGSWLITNSVSGSLVDVIMDYIRMIFHVDLMKFNSMRNCAMQNEEQIRLLYDTLGELELYRNIALFRDECTSFCEPVFYNSFEDRQDSALTLIAEQVRHPLLSDAVPNTIRAGRSVLLTGSNASGKSTFLKTLAINQIFAQTIHTCLANQFLTSFFKVLSSMALADNLLKEESYFVVEIKSLKRIFDETGDRPVLCFIDEVLRGTNTIERISASSVLLSELSRKNALVFAATHDIELTVLLQEELDNYHFSETVCDNEVLFDYTLKPGAADTSNAIRLMKAFGFEEHLVSSAGKRADDFRKSGIWQ